MSRKILGGLLPLFLVLGCSSCDFINDLFNLNTVLELKIDSIDTFSMDENTLLVNSIRYPDESLSSMTYAVDVPSRSILGKVIYEPFNDSTVAGSAVIAGEYIYLSPLPIMFANACEQVIHVVKPSLGEEVATIPFEHKMPEQLFYFPQLNRVALNHSYFLNETRKTPLTLFNPDTHKVDAIFWFTDQVDHLIEMADGSIWGQNDAVLEPLEMGIFNLQEPGSFSKRVDCGLGNFVITGQNELIAIKSDYEEDSILIWEELGDGETYKISLNYNEVLNIDDVMLRYMEYCPTSDRIFLHIQVSGVYEDCFALLERNSDTGRWELAEESAMKNIPIDCMDKFWVKNGTLVVYRGSRADSRVDYSTGARVLDFYDSSTLEYWGELMLE